MTATLILWGHALAALLFGMIALSRLRDAGTGLPRLTFVVALAATALWALAVAGIEARDLSARTAESIRNVAWLAFMFTLVRRDPLAPQGRAVVTVYGVVVLIVIAGMGLAMAEAISPVGPATLALADTRILLRMMVAVSALVLVHHLYSAVAPRTRGGIRLVVIALAAMWSLDLALYAIGYLGGQSRLDLIAARGIAMTLLAPVFGVAVHRNGDWSLQLSRTVAWRSLSFAAIALYLLMMALATSAIGLLGGPQARLFQTAFVFGSSAAILTLVSSPWLKAWAKVKLAKHFFRHRYDYRAEWVRFTDTLGKAEGASPLDQRIVKAVADLTDSPAGLLLVPDGTGLGIGAGWNWDRDGLPVSGGEEPLAVHLARSNRIIELDAVRQDNGQDAEVVPQWMVDLGHAWALVPLVHFDRLQGAILLARPPVDRALDWEDFDLLRIAGRQVASYLAEAGAQEALSEAQRFDEFNRRFAFILHDIKNLVSQLTLTARNAERHADNPDFRIDMVATLQDSAARMNGLLARLSQHHITQAEELRAIELLPLAERVAAGKRAQHPVVVTGLPATAFADPARLEQVLGHLVQNAIEATASADPVTIAIGDDAGRAVIEVIDHGCGMSRAFLRERLFKPFVSSKSGGFGIGAFEARQLAEAMGGSVTVTSREGEGSSFRIALAPVHNPAMEQAA